MNLSVSVFATSAISPDVTAKRSVSVRRVEIFGPRHGHVEPDHCRAPHGLQMPADAGRIRERPHGICKCMQYAGARLRRAILRNHPGDAALVTACTSPALATPHEPPGYR